ncbi:cytidine deaminase [Aulographum hederae CBS 113979]|uniref:Cytidine deaminase n=1 Tax=Aulographum hederae CBS 113979 TaxID=1176131 RepID=A0A6G1GZ01_9PEZI|nr:cytidine deaminase [Aulographum hederae CBS 113979]
MPPATPDEEAKLTAYGLSAAEINTLGTECINAKTRAYCPYSHFRVGCAILTKTPFPSTSLLSSPPSPSSTTTTLFTGANVENAAYPVGTCAERAALSTAVTQGGIRHGDVRAIGVAVDIKETCSPCGMCRQFIREFCEGVCPVVMWDGEGVYVVRRVEELLPLSFGPNVLPKPEELDAIREERGDKATVD